MAELARARIVNVTESKPGKPKAIEVLFNPEDYSLSRNNSWQSRGIGKDSGALEAEFTRLDALDLEVRLYLDNSLVSGLNGVSLETVIDQLIKLTEVPADALKASKGKGANAKLHPPVVRFEWGRLSFQGVITNFELSCTAFTREGRIRRAEVELSLMQCEIAETGKKPHYGQSTGMSVIQGEDMAQSMVRNGLDPKGYRGKATSMGVANPLKGI